MGVRNDVHKLPSPEVISESGSWEALFAFCNTILYCKIQCDGRINFGITFVPPWKQALIFYFAPLQQSEGGHQANPAACQK